MRMDCLCELWNVRLRMGGHFSNRMTALPEACRHAVRPRLPRVPPLPAERHFPIKYAVLIDAGFLKWKLGSQAQPLALVLVAGDSDFVPAPRFLGSIRSDVP